MPERTSSGRSVDVLADVFETVCLEAASVSRFDVELGRRQLEASRQLVVYVVVKGRLGVEVVLERFELRPGDALCLPRGTAHALRALPWKESIDSAAVVRADCLLAESERNPLLQVLPQSLLVSPSQGIKWRWLEPTLELLVREATSFHAGARVVVARLLELLVLQIARAYIATTPEESTGWLRALADPQIGNALGLIHDRPADEFTVAGLAHAVGMSRSAFATQFSRVVGESPLRYVSKYRMLKAAQLLKGSKRTIVEIAGAVGYDSEAAFNKAFKRWSGQSPGCYRRAWARAPHVVSTQFS